MAEREIKIIISAEDEAAYALNKVKSSILSLENQTLTSSEKMAAAYVSLKGTYLAGAAAITSAIYAVNEAWDLARETADFEEHKSGLQSLAAQYGTSADAMLTAIQDAASGTISKLDAVTIANKALIMGLDPEQITQTVEVAERLTGAVGGGVTESFDALTRALATGNERLLKQYGVLVDLEGAYKRYADSIGTTSDKLNEDQKRHAGAIEISKKFKEIMDSLGPATDTSADKIDRFYASVKDLGTELGGVFLPAATKVAESLTSMAKATNSVLTAISDVMGLKVKPSEQLILDYATQINTLTAELKTLKETAPASAFDFVNRILQANDDEQIFDLEMRIENLTYALNEQIGIVNKATPASKDLGKSYRDAKADVDNLASSLVALEKHLSLVADYASEAENLQKRMNEGSPYGLTLTATLDFNLLADTPILDSGALDEMARQAQDEAFAALSKMSPAAIQTAGSLPGELAEYSAMQDNLAQIQDYHAERIALMSQAGATEAEIREQYALASYQQEQQINQMRVVAATATVGMMADTLQSLFVATGSKNKALFTAYKAFAVGEALMSTYQAINKTLAQGGWWAIPLATAVGAMGFANAAAIAAQEMTGTVSSSTTTSTGATITTGSTDTSSLLSSSSSLSESTPTQEITINVYNPLDGKIGTDVAQSIIDAINDSGENLNYKISVNAIG